MKIRKKCINKEKLRNLAAPVHQTAEDHRHCSAHSGGQDPGSHDGCRVHAAVLAAVGDHIYRDQLQGRNVYNKERTHLVAGYAPLSYRSRQPSGPAVFLQAGQFLHGL